MTDMDQVRSYWCSPSSPKVIRWLRRDDTWQPDDEEWNARPDVTFVREYLAPRFAGRSVLDVGAGTGRWIHLWRRHDVALTSADMSPPHLEVLRGRAEAAGSAACQLDITTDHLEQRFDLVYASMVLLHIPPNRIRSALANIDRMCGRELLFTTWHDPDAVDDGDADKVQSFSHDYDSLFEECRWRVILRCDVEYPGRSSGRGLNRLWHLRVDR